MRKPSTRQRLLHTTMIGGAVLLASAFAPTFAAAQDQPEDEVEEIVVTGSRIPQANLTGTAPVTQVTGEDIDIAGVTRVEDLVTQLPQAFAAQNSTVSNGASGTATVSLRNLGSTRTLVLIDGRRMGYGSPNDTAADLNQIPEQLVERVEVLTGGASAVYGSDAIAGVVNFIMRKNFEGVQLDAQYGFYNHSNDYDGVGNLRNVIAGRAATNSAQFRLPPDNVNDGESKSVNLVMGVSSPDGKGNLLAYAGYRNNAAVLQGDRDYSACALGAPSAATPNNFNCGGSGTSFPGQFSDFANFAFTVGPNRTFVPYDASLNAYNFGPLNYYQRPDERYTLGAFGSYQINDKVEAFAQLMFSDYKSVAQIAPSGNFFSTSTINCGNPLLSGTQRTQIGCTPAQIAADATVPLFIGRRNVEGGGRQDSLNYNSYRIVGGIRGELAPGLNYDVAAQFSRVALARTYLNEFSVTRLRRALDVVGTSPATAQCRSRANGTDNNCVPYDIFTPGGVTQAALNYLQVPLVQTGETTQQVITAAITGDTGIRLPTASESIQTAFGFEYRRDYLKSVTDVTFSTGDGAGQGGPTIGRTGASEVYDVFAELQVPLLSDMPLAHHASIDAAYRRSEYRNDQTDTWKVGLDWAPVEAIRFRGSVSKAVRAANVIELFTAQGFNLFDAAFDPCTTAGRPASAGAVSAQCFGTNSWQVTTAQSNGGGLNSPAGQYNFLQGGNPNLKPEESDTYTFGFVLTPDSIPSFNLTVDYFNIEIEGLISTVGALNILDQCYRLNNLTQCARIQRNPGTGQLWIGTGRVENLNTNIGGLKTSGVDVNANYNLDLERLGATGLGNLGLSFTGTWLESLETNTGLGSSNSVYDCAGFYANQCGVPNPEWRHRARATWVTPWDISVSGTWRHYGEVEFASLGANGSLNNAGTRIDRFFDAENYFDVAGSWQLRDWVTLRAGVNNVLDNDPQLSYTVGTTGNGNTYPQIYDALGRYVFFGLTANF